MTEQDVERDAAEHINGSCNPRRRHSHNSYLSRIDFEHRLNNKGIRYNLLSTKTGQAHCVHSQKRRADEGDVQAALGHQALSLVCDDLSSRENAMRSRQCDQSSRWCTSIWFLTTSLVLFGATACSSHEGGFLPDDGVATTAQSLVGGGGLSTAALRLEVSKNSCWGNGAQDYFNIVNANGQPARLSDITIKYWVHDTSGSPVVPHVWYGGCVTAPDGTCTHPVAGVSVTAASFPACGPDAGHQASWEITVSTTDDAVIAPGSAWSSVQTALNLASFANFSPGSASWYSACGTGQPYGADPHSAVYLQGNLISSNGIAAPACRAPHGTQQMSGYLDKLGVVNAPIVGLVPPATKLSLTLALPLKPKNADGLSLEGFIKQASDPTSPQYRHYLTSETFASAFGPSPEDYQALIAWAGSAGLTVVNTYPNNSLLSVTGTAGVIDNALFANLVQRTRPDGSVFHSLDREPSVNLPVQILRVSGLENLRVSSVANVPCPASSPGDPTQNGTGEDSLFRGADFRNLYASCTTLDGGGAFPQSIGLLEFDTFKQLDVSQYLIRSGLPDMTIGSVTAAFEDDVHQFVNGPEEVLLDIDLAASMAPKAEIVVFGGLGPDEISFHNALLGLMTSVVPLPRVLSSSWTFDVDDETAQLLREFAAKGQSFFESSGDSGSYSGDPEDIRDLPYVTLVGATVVSTSGRGGPYLSETGWAGSSGGQFEGTEGVFGIGHVDSVPIPDYQRGVISSPGSGVQPDLRNAPDVAMLGANALIYRGCFRESVDGIFTGNITCPLFSFCGTSAATPLWAAFTALVNQKTEASGIGPMGFINPVLYAMQKNATVYDTTFNDITSGSNPLPAKAGYDLVTGLGSPKCALIDQLASTTPTVPLDAGPPPPPACSSAHLDLSAAAGQLAGRGPIFCGAGTGFTPNGVVKVEYIGVPSGVPSQLLPVGQADANGNVHFVDHSQGNAENPTDCTNEQESGFVQIIISDEGAGCVLHDLMPPDLWCPNSSRSQVGDGC